MRAHLQPSVAVRALRDGRRTELLRILTFLADLRTRLRAIRSWAKQAQASGSEARRAAEEAIALHRSTQDWLAGDLPAIQATVGIVNDPLVEAGFERFTDSQTRLAGRLASSTTQRPCICPTSLRGLLRPSTISRRSLRRSGKRFTPVSTGGWVTCVEPGSTAEVFAVGRAEF